MTGEALNIDYLSPLPPVRSGIADYSLDLLPHLAERADVRVVRLPGQEVDDGVVEVWRPIDAEVWLAQADHSRLPLYQMGNNPYHHEVERLAMRRPGALTLHDVVLHHYLLGRTLGEDDYEPYERRLTEDHGWIGARAAKPFSWGAFGNAAQFALPAHRRLVRRQRGILVHSDWAHEVIGEEEPDVAVFPVTMGIPPGDGVAGKRGRDFRRRFAIPEGAFLLGSFGFQTPMKRPQQAMRALLEPGMEHVHLLIAGEIAATTGVRRQIFELELAERVHVTGFLDFADFEAAIAASDLALNLRYPSAGETSASLLRVLAVGKAALISDYAQFAELPDDVGVKVPVGEGEVAAIATAVRDLTADRRLLLRMEQAARQYVARQHRLEDAADTVIAACREIAQRQPPAPRPVSLPPPSSLIWHDLPASVEVDLGSREWPEGEMRTLSVRLTNRSCARWLAGSNAEGGVNLEVGLWQGDRDLLRNRQRLALGCDLDPGESASFETTVRRPLGDAELQVRLAVGRMLTAGERHQGRTATVWRRSV